jgi:hypothetical protein
MSRGRSPSPRKRTAPRGPSDGNDLLVPHTDNISVPVLTHSESQDSLTTNSMSSPPRNKAAYADQGPSSTHNQSTTQGSVTTYDNYLPSRMDPILKNPSKRRRLTTIEDEDEQQRISVLRATALRKSRPSNPMLICCDYAAAEKARITEEYGREEFGGGHLCMEYLRLEVRSADKGS